MDTWFIPLFTPPTCKTVMALHLCWPRSSGASVAAPRFADGGYAGSKLRDALQRIGKWTVEIIKRSDLASGFEVLPWRWVVERWPGSIVTDTSPRISSSPSHPLPLGCSSPQSNSSPDGSQGSAFIQFNFGADSDGRKLPYEQI
jgi:hypothetical protein